MLAETTDRESDRRRNVVGDGDPFDAAADLRAQRADRVPLARVQARQPIQPLVDRWRLGQDPPEGVRRHAEGGWYTDALDPRKLPQVRALAADDRDLRPVDLCEIQDRRMLPSAHRVAPFVACGERVSSTPGGLKQAPLAAILWMWRGWQVRPCSVRSGHLQ